MSSPLALAGHLNRGIDGVFEIVRVACRGLLSFAAHAIVAERTLRKVSPRWRAIDLASSSVMDRRSSRALRPRSPLLGGRGGQDGLHSGNPPDLARRFPIDGRALMELPLSRFAPRAELVTLCQRFVRRSHHGDCPCRRVKNERWNLFSSDFRRGSGLDPDGTGWPQPLGDRAPRAPASRQRLF